MVNGLSWYFFFLSHLAARQCFRVFSPVVVPHPAFLFVYVRTYVLVYDMWGSHSGSNVVFYMCYYHYTMSLVFWLDLRTVYSTT